MNHIRGVLLLIPLALSLSCSSAETEREIAPRSARPASPVSASVPSEPDLRPLVVAFGNSLTAGLGVAPGGSYPGQLQLKIDASGYKYRVVNAGVSGDTSSQGVNRLQSIIASASGDCHR